MNTQYLQSTGSVHARGVSRLGRYIAPIFILGLVALMEQTASAASGSGSEAAPEQQPVSIRDLNIGKLEGWEFE